MAGAVLFLAAAFTLDPPVARAEPLVEWGETFLEAVVDDPEICGGVAMTQHWFCFPTEIDGCPADITELGWDTDVDRQLGDTGPSAENGSAHLTLTSGCGDAIIDPYFAMAVDPELSLDYTIPPDSIVQVKGWVRTSDARSGPVVRGSWRWFDGTKGHDLQKTIFVDNEGDGIWDVEYTVSGVNTPWTGTRIPALDAGIDPLWVPFEILVQAPHIDPNADDPAYFGEALIRREPAGLAIQIGTQADWAEGVGPSPAQFWFDDITLTAWEEWVWHAVVSSLGERPTGDGVTEPARVEALPTAYVDPARDTLLSVGMTRVAAPPAACPQLVFDLPPGLALVARGRAPNHFAETIPPELGRPAHTRFVLDYAYDGGSCVSETQGGGSEYFEQVWLRVDDPGAFVDGDPLWVWFRWEPDDPAVDCAWEEGDDGTWYCGEPVQTELQVLSEPLPLYPRPTRLRADVSGQSDMGTLFTDVAADAPYDVLPLLDAAGVDGPSTSSQLMRVAGGFDVADYTPPESCVGLTGDEALLCPLARLREDVEARGMSMRSYGAAFQGQAVTYDDAHKSHLPNNVISGAG